VVKKGAGTVGGREKVKLRRGGQVAEEAPGFGEEVYGKEVQEEEAEREKGTRQKGKEAREKGTGRTLTEGRNLEERG
jgi:hypothetical protein